MTLLSGQYLGGMIVSIIQLMLELGEAELLLMVTRQVRAELEWSPGPSHLCSELRLQGANLAGQPLCHWLFPSLSCELLERRNPAAFTSVFPGLAQCRETQKALSGYLFNE